MRPRAPAENCVESGLKASVHSDGGRERMRSRWPEAYPKIRRGAPREHETVSESRYSAAADGWGEMRVKAPTAVASAAEAFGSVRQSADGSSTYRRPFHPVRRA